MANELIQAYNELSIERIAKGEAPIDQDIDNTKTQLKIFLVAQAQRELKTIVRLTETLDKLQNEYENVIDDMLTDMNTEQLSIILPQAIDTISKCLQRSNDIISKVIGNDKIMNFQILSADNNSSINIGNTQNNSNICDLNDPQSRKKVRDTVNEILKYVQDMQEGEIIDTETNGV